MAIIKGGDLMLFIGNKSIGYATSHSLSISADTKETSTKDSGGKWQTSEVGLISWTASSENLYANEAKGMTYSDLFNSMVNRTELDAVFALKDDSTNSETGKSDTGKSDTVPTNGWTPKAKTGYQGKVIITSIELNAPNGEDASFTVQFQGTGPLKAVPNA